MPAIISMLWGGLLYILRSAIGKILLYLGVTYYTYQGVDIMLDLMKHLSFSTLSGSMGGDLSIQLSGLFGLMRLGEVFNVLFSAYSARLVLQGLNSFNGSAMKMVFKK